MTYFTIRGRRLGEPLKSLFDGEMYQDADFLHTGMIRRDGYPPHPFLAVSQHADHRTIGGNLQRERDLAGGAVAEQLAFAERYPQEFWFANRLAEFDFIGVFAGHQHLEFRPAPL